MSLLSASPEKSFRQGLCIGLDCRRLFFICSACDHGQRYCSKFCSLKARGEQKRAARRRYRRSFRGRRNQAQRQQAYRRRIADRDRARASAAENLSASLNPTSEAAEKIVTDPSSIATPTSSTIAQLPVPAPFLTPRQRLLSEFGQIVCCFCGRVGRFLNPFDASG